MQALQILIFLQMICACACYFCDRDLTGRSGDVSGPGNSSSYYDGGMDCKYSITAPRGEYLKLTWSYFNVRGEMPNCNEDYVQVYTGCSFNKNRISRFCSTNMNGKPHSIYSHDNCIEVRFHSQSGGSRYNGGFRFSYTSSTTKAFSSCSSSRTTYSTSGVIGSPGWPFKIDKSGLPWDKECKTTIRQTNTKRVIKLNFMDMDVTSSSSCSSFSSTYVKYEGEKSVLRSGDEKRYFCQKGGPFSLETEYYEVDIKLEVSSFSSPSGRGFVVGWVAYEDDEAAKVTKYGWIAGVVIGLIVLGVVVFLVYRRYHRRNTTSYVRTTVPAQTATTITTNTGGTTNYPQQKQYVPPPTGQQPYPQQQYAPPPPQQQYGPPIHEGQQGFPAQAPPPYPGPTTHVDGGVPPYAPQYQPQPGYPPQQPAYPPMQQAPYPPPAGYGATNYQPPPVQ